MRDLKSHPAERFDIPEYDFEAVRRIAQSTDLSSFYDACLEDPFSIAEDDFRYGLAPVIVRKLHERLKDGFDWSEWTAKMKDMGEHYTLDLEGLEAPGHTTTIHYVHRPSRNKNAIPLIFVHGWPGSFLEFEKILPLLSDDYHLVVPSMVGFGFSSKPRVAAGRQSGVPAYDVTAFATGCHHLMKSLGYDKYVAQGGDIGQGVVRALAVQHPDGCKAIHLNNIHFSQLKHPDEKEEDLTEDERRGLERGADFQRNGYAYFMMHATVPYTMGAILATSPMATIVHISEKLFRWTAPETKPSLDFCIANSLLYYFTGTTTSSFWNYFQMYNDFPGMSTIQDDPINQPAAITIGPYDLNWATKKVCEGQFKHLKTYKVLGKGGHFAASEVPELLKDEMDALFKCEDVASLLR